MQKRLVKGRHAVEQTLVRLCPLQLEKNRNDRREGNLKKCDIKGFKMCKS
jgi:hypothetical protein